MNRAHRIADQVRNVVGFLNRVPSESQFLSKGLLTPAEFVEAGEQLVFQCPSWQWQGCHARKKQVFWLPPSKQYLLTRNIPCRHRVTDWDKSFCRNAHMTSEGWLVPGHLTAEDGTTGCSGGISGGEPTTTGRNTTSGVGVGVAANIVVRKSVECKVKTADGDEWAVRHGSESSENDDEDLGAANDDQRSCCSPSLRTPTSSSACSSGLGELATVCSKSGNAADSNSNSSSSSSTQLLGLGSTAAERHSHSVAVAVVRRRHCYNSCVCNTNRHNSGCHTGRHVEQRHDRGEELFLPHPSDDDLAAKKTTAETRPTHRHRHHRSSRSHRGAASAKSTVEQALTAAKSDLMMMLPDDFVEIDEIGTRGGSLPPKEIDEDGDFTVIGEEEEESKMKTAVVASVKPNDDDDDDDDDDDLDDGGNLSSQEEDTSGKNSQNLVPTRSYDLSITYDKYYQSPRLWLFGYDESGVPLRADAVFEDIHSDYLSKTVTVDPHPFTGVPTVSVHPCKHASVMRNVAQSWLRSGITPRHDLALFVLLKMVSSVVPTINFDFTIDIEMPIGISFEEKSNGHADDEEAENSATHQKNM